MSLLSKSCVYGLRATLYVASFGAERSFVSIREVADELKLSFHFLTKILQQLTEAGIMQSYRGPNGGVSLARPPAKISLYDIVCAIDGDGAFTSCILGLAECSDHHPCPLHGKWGGQRAELREALTRSTLASLRGPITSKQIRLADRAATPAGRRKRGQQGSSGNT